MKETNRHPAPAPADQLTLGRISLLVALATFVWFCVANFIRVRAPLGGFDGLQGVLTYAVTVPVTIVVNELTPRIVGLSPRQTLPAVAVTLATAPTLEGIVMRCCPAVYGQDPANVAKGAIWLLWAIGVALALAVRTSLQGDRRLQAGDSAPTINATNVLGGEVMVPDAKAPLTHVQFLRFAGCPVCNLLLQGYVKRADEIRAAGIKEVILFHSRQSLLVDHQAKFPFDVVADPEKTFFAEYQVESSPWAVLSPLAWVGLVKGYLRRPAGIPDSSPFGLPAEFLVEPDGTIIASHYGSHSSDQWSVDTVLQLARSGPQPELTTPGHPEAAVGPTNFVH